MWSSIVAVWRSVARLGKPYGTISSRDDEYQAQVTWAKGYVPKAGKPYEQAHEYAAWRYDVLRDHWDALDKKADDIIRYGGILLTAVGTLSTILVVQHADDPKFWVGAWMLLPSFVLVAASIVLALLARKPESLTVPGNAREVLGFVEDDRITDEQQIRALIGAALHAATAGLRPLVTEKARRITVALIAMTIGLALLALPLVSATCQ